MNSHVKTRGAALSLPHGTPGDFTRDQSLMIKRRGLLPPPQF